MTEWGVVGVIVTLIGIVAVFVKVTLSYSAAVGELKTSIAVLNTSIERLTEDLNEIADTSSKKRELIFSRLGNAETKIGEHEIRIDHLEKRS